MINHRVYQIHEAHVHVRFLSYTKLILRKKPTVLQSAATPANKLLTKTYELQIAVHSGVNTCIPHLNNS